MAACSRCAPPAPRTPPHARSRRAATRAGPARARRCRSRTGSRPRPPAAAAARRVSRSGRELISTALSSCGAGREDELRVELRLGPAAAPSEPPVPRSARCSARGCRCAGSRPRRPCAGSSPLASMRSLEWTLRDHHVERASRSGSWSSEPSSRMSTSMPVRIRNGASCLVELARPRRAAGAAAPG